MHRHVKCDKKEFQWRGRSFFTFKDITFVEPGFKTVPLQFILKGAGPIEHYSAKI